MTKKKLYLTALLLSLAAVGLWRWQHQRELQRQERRAQWQAYLQGPLSDYLYGSTRGQELLLKPSAADKAALGEAVASMRRSEVAVAKMKDAWQLDPFFGELVQAAALHSEAAELAETWPRLELRAKAQVDRARSGAAAISRNLAQRLDAQRMRVMGDLKPSKDEVLEMNALIYSVREGAGETVPRSEKP